MHRARAFVFGLIILIAPLPAVPGGAPSAARDNSMDEFAKCLRARNATMYGSFWCRHCEDQKAMFGRSFQHVRYVECSVKGMRQPAFECQAVGIRHTPTWVFGDGERRTGLLSLKVLSDKTGCPLPLARRSEGARQWINKGE